MTKEGERERARDRERVKEKEYIFTKRLELPSVV